VPTQLTNPCKK